MTMLWSPLSVLSLMPNQSISDVCIYIFVLLFVHLLTLQTLTYTYIQPASLYPDQSSLPASCPKDCLNLPSVGNIDHIQPGLQHILSTTLISLLHQYDPAGINSIRLGKIACSTGSIHCNGNDFTCLLGDDGPDWGGFSGDAHL